MNETCNRTTACLSTWLLLLSAGHAAENLPSLPKILFKIACKERVLFAHSGKMLATFLQASLDC